MHEHTLPPPLDVTAINRRRRSRIERLMDLSAMTGGAWPCELQSIPDRYCGHYVYLLSADDGTLLYVGETKDLRTRLKRHARNKNFVHWSAFRMLDRRQALAFEAAVTERFPPLLFENGALRTTGERVPSRYVRSYSAFFDGGPQVVAW